jgi:pantetheine-phosphate adenylyltransferase
MTKNLKSAIFPGSFDPPTLGHVNIVERSLNIFDHVIIAVGINTSKKNLFSTDERIAMLQEIFKDNENVTIEAVDGLMVEYAKKKDVFTIIRGIRTISDYDYELQMSLANRSLDGRIETIFLMTEGHLSHIRSSIIREVIAMGGTSAGMLPDVVERKLKERL